ncbi:MAG: PIN domain-containing protein [Verrucomicrobiae bacterium]|nr:PIN domain-containing protein [Verrucomicrobiae bacterium]
MIIDTNVVLDALLFRDPFVHAAAKILGMAERSEIEAFLGATTVTTIDYLIEQSLPEREARAALRHLLELFDVAPVNRAVLERALAMNMRDYEDAVISAAGELVGAEAVVTRNTKDFVKCPLRVLQPDEFLAILKG